MNITSRKITVPRTAHYAVSGRITSKTKELWLVLHGYGQMADEFLNIFRTLADTQRVVIAPEALSSFYLRRSSGKTGASWMTRSHREDEIKDYLLYLDLLAAEILSGKTKKLRIVLFGFSQGSETAVRWFLHSKVPIQSLIIWAGLLPPETDFSRLRSKLKKSSLYMVYGTHDRLLPADIRDKMFSDLAANEIVFEKLSFAGGHGITQQTLARVQSVLPA